MDLSYTTMRCRNLIFRPICLLIFAVLFSACDGHWWNDIPGMGGFWWERGQPRSPQNQLVLAEDRLNKSLSKNGAGRKDVEASFNELTKTLDATVSDVSSNKPTDQIEAHLLTLEKQYLAVSGKLSIGSRPAFAELSSQLRSIHDSYAGGTPVDVEAVKLYAARTKMLMASELKMQPPVLQD